MQTPNNNSMFSYHSPNEIQVLLLSKKRNTSTAMSKIKISGKLNLNFQISLQSY